MKDDAAAQIQGAMAGNDARAIVAGMEDEAVKTMQAAMSGFGTRNDLAALVTVLDTIDVATTRVGVDAQRVKALVFLDLFCTLNVEDHLQSMVGTNACKEAVAASLGGDGNVEGCLKVLGESMAAVEPYLSTSLVPIEAGANVEGGEGAP